MSKLEVKNTTDLIRLYLNWPERTDNPDNEAELFHAWLHKKYPQLSVVRNHCSIEQVSDFLHNNAEVIEACRVLKTEKSTADTGRSGMRVSMVAQAFVVIFDSQDKPELIGTTMKSTIIDVSSSGIGLQLDAAIPRTSIVSVTIVPPGTPISIFNLSAETRWCIEKNGSYQAGLKFYTIDDYEKWQEEFSRRFMPR